VELPELLGLVEEALSHPLVLVVEDDHDLCVNMWDLLRDRGYRVGMAHDEATATAALSDAVFQVVLIDLKLPDSDGGRVFQRVRAANPEARTVLITGCQGEMSGIIEELLGSGADALCYKPFDMDHLLSTIRRLCQHATEGGVRRSSEP
jgi:two-component system response regulator HydG